MSLYATYSCIPCRMSEADQRTIPRANTSMLDHTEPTSTYLQSPSVSPCSSLALKHPYFSPQQQVPTVDHSAAILTRCSSSASSPQLRRSHPIRTMKSFLVSPETTRKPSRHCPRLSARLIGEFTLNQTTTLHRGTATV
jgi:hypothetical protein